MKLQTILDKLNGATGGFEKVDGIPQIYYSTGLCINAENKREYNKIIKKLSNIEISKESYTLTCSYDGGGYDYWKEQNDYNYADINIELKGELTPDEFETLDLQVHLLFMKLIRKNGITTYKAMNITNQD